MDMEKLLNNIKYLVGKYSKDVLYNIEKLTEDDVAQDLVAYDISGFEEKPSDFKEFYEMLNGKEPEDYEMDRVCLIESKL